MDNTPTLLSPSMARLLLYVLANAPGNSLPHPLESAADADVEDALRAIAEGITVVVLAP